MIAAFSMQIYGSCGGQVIAYMDADRRFAHPAPIVADQDGVFPPVYLADGEYRVETRDFQGNVISTISPVQVNGLLAGVDKLRTVDGVMDVAERAQTRRDDRPLSTGEQIVDDYEQDIIAQPWELSNVIDDKLKEAEQAARQDERRKVLEGAAHVAETFFDWCRPIGEHTNMALAQEFSKECSARIRALAEEVT